jgi:hypothetical protein
MKTGCSHFGELTKRGEHCLSLVSRPAGPLILACKNEAHFGGYFLLGASAKVILLKLNP